MTTPTDRLSARVLQPRSATGGARPEFQPTPSLTARPVQRLNALEATSAHVPAWVRDDGFAPARTYPQRSEDPECDQFRPHRRFAAHASTPGASRDPRDGWTSALAL